MLDEVDSDMARKSTHLMLRQPPRGQGEGSSPVAVEPDLLRQIGRRAPQVLPQRCVRLPGTLWWLCSRVSRPNLLEVADSASAPDSGAGMSRQAATMARVPAAVPVSGGCGQACSQRLGDDHTAARPPPLFVSMTWCF